MARLSRGRAAYLDQSRGRLSSGHRSGSVQDRTLEAARSSDRLAVYARSFGVRAGFARAQRARLFTHHEPLFLISTSVGPTPHGAPGHANA